MIKSYDVNNTIGIVVMPMLAKSKLAYVSQIRTLESLVPIGPSMVTLDTLKGKPIPRLGYRPLLGFKHYPKG